MRSDWRELALVAVTTAFVTYLLSAPQVDTAVASPPSERSSESGPWCKRWKVERKPRTKFEQIGAAHAEPFMATGSTISWRTCVEMIPTHAVTEARRKAEAARRARQVKAQQKAAGRIIEASKKRQAHLERVSEVKLGSALAVDKANELLTYWIGKQVRFHRTSGGPIQGTLSGIRATLAWLKVDGERKQVDLIAVRKAERLR